MARIAVVDDVAVNRELLAVILKFGKLILIGLVAGGAAVWAGIKRFFGRRDPDVI